MTFDKFIVEIFKTQNKTGWRLGQAIFNVLAENRPDLAEKIRGTEMDPFYVQENPQKINEIMDWLEGNWNQEQP